jgi:ABC-type branched-subunit amino acid transport system permease subunit
MVGYLIFLTTSIAIYALFSLGLNLQWGFTGLINFGHVVFMLLGAYSTVLLSAQGVPLFLAVPAGALLAMGLGLLIGVATLRLRQDYLAIVTISVSEVARLIVLNEEWLTRGSFGVRNFPLPLENLGGPETGRIARMILVLLVLALVFWGLERLLRSPWGRVLKAIREDEEVAKALGKNVFWYKLQSLMIGGAIAAVAGSFNAWLYKTVYPNDFQPQVTFDAWVIVVLGGAGNNLGTLLGAVIYAAYYSITLFVLPGRVPLDDARLGAFRIMVIGLVLMVLMIWRPQGILGKGEELTLGR